MLNNIKSILILTILLSMLTYCSSSKPAAVQDEGSDKIAPAIAYPSSYPDHIILNLTQDPATSISVAWRTSTVVSKGMVEIAKAGHGPNFTDDVRQVAATMHALTSTSIPAHYFNVTVNDLQPAQTYVYRVGSGDHWSEWIQYTTPAGNGEAFSFIYFGDAQNDIKSMWSRVIREAYATMPKAAFMLHAGDLVNRYNSDVHWDEWFNAGAFIHAMVPGMMTPGNHEYRAGKLSPQWQPQFSLPMNGPEGFEETCYYVDYENMRIISLNSMKMVRDNKSIKPQIDWLKEVLENNPKEWTAVTLHHPLFATKPGRDNDLLRNNLKPLFDEYNVDLVLQGHDHAYGRGHNVPEGTTGEEGRSRTMYVVSVSGPKMYELSDEEWMDRRANETQLFQLISVDGKVLRYEAYTAAGMLYDAFEINKEGDTKSIINRIPDVPERVE